MEERALSYCYVCAAAQAVSYAPPRHIANLSPDEGLRADRYDDSASIYLGCLRFQFFIRFSVCLPTFRCRSQSFSVCLSTSLACSQPCSMSLSLETSPRDIEPLASQIIRMTCNQTSTQKHAKFDSKNTASGFQGSPQAPGRYYPDTDIQRRSR